MERLTWRQLQMLEGLRRGMSVEQIATACNIAPPTAKTHISCLYRKFGATNAAQAVDIGYRTGWLRLSHQPPEQHPLPYRAQPVPYPPPRLEGISHAH